MTDENKGYSNAIVYRPPNYPGPIAIDQKPSEELKDYHRNARIEIRSPNWVVNLRVDKEDVK